MTQPLVALVGAEIEENLSIRYLAAAVESAGFRTVIIPFNGPDDERSIVADIASADPLAVGISVPFQLRAAELLRLATSLRSAGYGGHVTAGGHFATFEFANILRDFPGIDSVVRHEGEHTLTEMCGRLRDGTPIDSVPGVVVRSANGVLLAERRSLSDLDDLPFPIRRKRPDDVLGIPCAPILGSRGCYAHCSFCCIHAYTRNAAGPRYRRRSAESIVREMAREYETRGVRLFVFHDDNFFVPSLSANMSRYERMAGLIQREGLDGIGLVVKCRPHDAHPELLDLMRSIGLIRAYVGIETNSNEGLVSLNRGIGAAGNRAALEAFRDAEIYCSFNVLIFDPDATLTGFEENLHFMEEFADIPFNFCRAEVYAGTPLKDVLAHQGRLMGDYLAWGYEMRDPRVELLFRIVSTAFAPRNFKPDGVAHLNMGVRFDHEVLRHFYTRSRDPEQDEQMVGLSRAIGQDSVEKLRRALWFVRHTDPYDADSVKDFTMELARSVADSDLAFLAEIREARRDAERSVVAHEMEPDLPAMTGAPGLQHRGAYGY